MRIYSYYVSFEEMDGGKVISQLEEFLRGKYNCFLEANSISGDVRIIDTPISVEHLNDLEKILGAVDPNWAKIEFSGSKYVDEASDVEDYKKKAAEFAKSS